MDSIPYGKQSIDDEDIEAVVNILKSNFLTQGPEIYKFECAFAEYVGAKYAVAVSSGTAALHLSVLALGLRSGNKVISSPITFAASSNCILYAGGEVVFADINPHTLCLDFNHVKNQIEQHPKGTFKGVIPIDFAGYPFDLEPLKELADEYNFWILEDACHALGGHIGDVNKRKLLCGNGKYADCSVFSFHPVKHITTGEGGMITTSKKEIYKKLLSLRTHGINKLKSFQNKGGWYYEMQALGYNYRLTDFQAALGISQLKKINNWLEKRAEIAFKYNAAFQDTSITVPKSNFSKGHAFHLYVILVEDRKGLYDYLRNNKIYTQVHYIPVHLHPFYRQFGYKYNDFPESLKYYQHCLSLPMYPSLTVNEQDFVIEKVLQFIDGK